jgi:hypothetical protein
MRKLGLALIFLAILAGCGPASEWRELAVPEGGFAILMRGQPQYFPQQLDTPAGKMSAYLYSSDRPDAYFAVGYTDFPLALAVGAAPDKIFAGARDTWVKRIDGTPGRLTPLKLAGKYPGVHFTAEGKYRDREAVVEGRLYLVDQRLYQMVAISEKGAIAQGVVNRFLASFRLMPVVYTEKMQIKPPPAK